MKNSKTISLMLDRDGKTFSHHYARMGQLDKLTQRIKLHPEEIQHQDKNGNTPIHLAIMYGYFDCAKLLNKAEAVKTKNNKGLTPLMIAKKKIKTNEKLPANVKSAVPSIKSWKHGGNLAMEPIITPEVGFIALRDYCKLS